MEGPCGQSQRRGRWSEAKWRERAAGGWVFTQPRCARELRAAPRGAGSLVYRLKTGRAGCALSCPQPVQVAEAPAIGEVCTKLPALSPTGRARSELSVCEQGEPQAQGKNKQQL